MKIYVGNLSFDSTEAEIEGAFVPFGQVDEVRVITDRDSGRSRGFAFVGMPKDEEAKAAIEGLNGKDLRGRQLTVNESRPRDDGRQRSGRW